MHGMTKNDLRRAALSARDALGETVRIEAAFALTALFPLSLPVQDACVGAYWPIGSEIDPRPLMQALAASGARLALPVIEDGAMAFRALSREGDLVPQGFGTYGPSPAAPRVTPDILLAPLAAFDAQGRRIGYGKGFYDRYLASLAKKPLVIGLAFCAQEIGSIPAEPHDVPLNAVLTERFYRTFP